LLHPFFFPCTSPFLDDDVIDGEEIGEDKKSEKHGLTFHFISKRKDKHVFKQYKNQGCRFEVVFQGCAVRCTRSFVAVVVVVDVVGCSCCVIYIKAGLYINKSSSGNTTMRVDGSYFLLCFIVAMEIVGLELHVTTFVALLMVMVLANVDDDDGDGGVAAQLQAAAGHTRA